MTSLPSRALSAALCLCLLSSCGSFAQSTLTSQPFPYIFDNLVWWQDADLRQELKERLPSLGDQIVPLSPMEAKVRSALTAMLLQKNVHAEVQTIEPTSAQPGAQRAPGAPPPSIIFTLLPPPAILTGKVTVENAPPETIEALNASARRMESSTYAAHSFWIHEDDFRAQLRNFGYLTATVQLRPQAPTSDEKDHFLVPILASLQPGPQYRVGKLSADGGPLLQGRDLSPYIALHPGDIAKADPFGRLIGLLRSTYWQAGYAEVSFQSDPILEPGPRLADFRLEMIPGPRYTIHTITVQNLSPSQEANLREKLGMKAGDIYNLMLLTSLSSHLATIDPSLTGYHFGYSPQLDRDNHLVDLDLNFFKDQ